MVETAVRNIEEGSAVLIVTHDAQNISYLLPHLQKEGMHVTVQAYEQCDALERRGTVPFNLVVVDTLYQDDLKRIHALKSAGIPVVFISSETDITYKMQCFEWGCADYILKSFDSQEVCARLKVHLRLHLQKQLLVQQEQRFQDWVECASDWRWETDSELRITYLSDYFFDVTQRDAGTVLRKTLLAVCQIDENSPSLRETIMHCQGFQDYECLVETEGNPSTLFMSISGKPLFDESGVFKGYRGIGTNITEKKKSRDKVVHLAYHDALTGLPNRSSFNTTLTHALDRSRRYNSCLAVLFIDLDRFKNVNDTLGHAAGDILLQEVSGRLEQILRKCDVVSRFGGDEFVILLEDIEKPANAEVVARKVLSVILEPIQLHGKPFHITGSVGISMYPDDARDEQTLLKNADIAMYRAKDQGKNTYQFYSSNMNAYSFERLVLESSLRVALEHKELTLHYQAKLDLMTRQVTGMEVLLRWNHPDLGIVSPAQFIPIAEETGLIVPIGRWVLSEACRQNKAWQDEGFAPIRVAVNLSPRQFLDNALVDDIAAILKTEQLDPCYLELEITESMVMSNPQRTIEQLKKIREMGIMIAMDDFGTGYSSLASLKHFPVDTIKIDRSFISELPGNGDDMAIIKAIIAMGKTMSMTVVAEGVETEQQLNFLKSQDCDEMQGYYFSKPIPALEFRDLLTKNQQLKDVVPVIPN